MIDHPFLDFKDLSDDELLNKTADIHGKLNKAYMWGSSTAIVEQLQWMLEMIEEEKDERLKRQNFAAIQAMFPEVVESDPSFKKEKVEEPDATARVVKPDSKNLKDMPEPAFHKEYRKPEGKDDPSE